MTERDQWTERLRCPNCGTDGRAVLSQASPNSPAYHDGTDQNVRVELTPSGFRFTVSDLGCKFYCADCGAPAYHG
jgi:hypothetical protein